MVRLAMIAAVGTVAISFSCRQAVAVAFQNLDFEESQLDPSNPYQATLPSSQALPHWTVVEGIYVASQVGYDTVALDAPAVTLHDALHPGFGNFTPLEGNYSVLLQTGTLAGSNVMGRNYVSISQIGDVPMGARSIECSLDCEGTLGDDFRVVLGGVNVGWGGNISAFAGQTGVELRLEAEGDYRTEFRLDAIRFVVAPEPAAIVHFGVAVAVLAPYAWRYRRTNRIARE